MNILSKQDFNIGKLFLILGFFFSFVYSVLVPPFGANDEDRHFLKAYSYAYGKINKDVYLPMKVFTISRDNIRRQHLNWEMDRYDIKKENFFTYFFEKDTKSNQLIKIKKNRSDVYSPVVYWPAVIMIFIGEKLDLSYFRIFYLSRFALFFACNLLIYFAIKNSRNFAVPFFLVAMIPGFLVNRSTINADGLTYSYILYFLSLVIRLYENKVERNDVIKLFFSALFIGFSKSVYTPLILLSLLIKQFRKMSGVNKIKFVILLIILPFLFSALWAVAASERFSKRTIQFDEDPKTGLGIGFLPSSNEPQKQIRMILEQPLVIAGKVLLTLPAAFMNIMFGTTGAVIFPKIETHYILWVVCMILLFANNNKNYFSGKDIKIISFINSVIFFAILMITYVTWSNSDSQMIEGFQPRYFLPNIILILICLKTRLPDSKHIIVNNLSVMMFILLNISGLVNILQIYYKF